ncbi:uncharacterized protein LOC112324338 isoform X2 [Populus trichocarpa]|uniref:uncharacterized protein LOC112324338 isoform X2 n=1 Tax=Populus trichocarpa TaxID=3694 RepID=UPI002277CBEE|nr:uncharacterized protein LOC112324338 isoform X2 [Populus trichocarpa]
MPVTRFTNQSQVQLDLEIEKTLRRLRNEARLNTMVVARQQTLKELAGPNVENQPLCINIDNNVNFELKSGFIHLLPTFNGLAGEDPHTHLKEFHMVCVGMKLNGVDKEQVKLKAFPFSLKGAAKAWFFSILPGSVGTWNAMKKIFLEKYFPASRVANIRKEICGIRQSHGETLSEYWERFEQLCIQCPHHQIPDQLLIQYFYEGLMPTDRSIIDAASGGALVEKTPEAARQLISNMAANSKQFGMRGDFANKQVNKVHAVDGGFNGQSQRKYDPFSDTYNPEWRDHPNLCYGNPPQQGNQGRQFHPNGFQPQQNYQARQPPPFTNSNVLGSSSSDDLREMMKTLASNTVTLQQNIMSFQQETRSGIHNLKKQMGQVASSVGKLEAQINGKLPSQTLNSIENVSVIMLRSGKELEEKRSKQIEMEEEEEIETELSTKKEHHPPLQSVFFCFSLYNVQTPPPPNCISSNIKI